MKSMKIAKKDARGEEIVSDSPYPYGLSINLENESLDKLEIKILPEIGDVMLVTAKVKVISISEHKQEGTQEPHRSVSLQITDMELASDKKVE